LLSPETCLVFFSFRAIIFKNTLQDIRGTWKSIKFNRYQIFSNKMIWSDFWKTWKFNAASWIFKSFIPKRWKSTFCDKQDLFTEWLVCPSFQLTATRRWGGSLQFVETLTLTLTKTFKNLLLIQILKS
jgi:hypothetical protein